MRGPSRNPLAGLVRGAMTLMLSTVAGSALGVVFWIVGARIYGSEELGAASAGFSAITLLGTVAALSLGTVLVRFLPTSGRHAGQMVRYAQAVAACVGIVVAVIAWFSGLPEAFLPEQGWAFLFFCGAVACAALQAVQDGALTGLGDPRWVAVRTVAVSVGRIAMVAALAGAALASPLLLGWGMPLIAVSAATVVMLLATTAVRRMPGREVLPTPREAASFATSQYLIVVVGSVAQQAPPILVTLVLGAQVNGSAFHIPWLVAGVAAALSWNGCASFVVTATREPERARAHVRHLLLILAAVLVVGAALLAAAAPVFLGLLGEQYRAGLGPLLVILVTLPFLGITHVYSAAAIVDKRTWPTLGAEVASTAVFLIGAYWGMHRYGVMGAVGAFLVANVVVGLAVLPATVGRIRSLIVEGERAVEAVTARGVARVPGRAVPEVAALGPGADGAQITVVFFPDIDGSLAAAQTAVLPRARDGDSPTQRLARVFESGEPRA